jgi:tetratricopeptide (TPR) repeat protein
MIIVMETTRHFLDTYIALAIDPKLEIALYNKGDTLKSLGNYTGAITYLNRSLAINPNDRDAKLDLAQANRLHVVELAQPTHHNATFQRPSVSR